LAGASHTFRLRFMDVQVTANFEFLVDNTARIALLQGSSRSSKTYSCCQWIIYYCLNNSEKIVTVARDNLVVNRRTVFLDFMQILKGTGLKYSLNKTELTVTINTSIVRFIGLDDSSKIHGLKQDICYVNEGLSVSKDIYLQLLQRTSDKMIVDYNPSMVEHFLYDWADTRDDCVLFASTIFDNPLAPPEAVKQILSYEPTPENERQNTANEYYWRVYGLGERFRGDDVVIRKFYRYTEELEDNEVEWSYMGMDFGFRDPTVLIVVKKMKNTNKLFCRILLHQVALTNQAIAEAVLAHPLIDKGGLIIADSAEPKSITELRLAGLSVTPASKGQGSIYYGMQKIMQYELHVFKDRLSDKLAQELETVRFQTDVNGDIVKDSKGNPILVGNGFHCIDPLRYSICKFMVG
jgi:phage terminase large subunit